MVELNGVPAEQQLKEFNDYLSTRAYLRGFLFTLILNYLINFSYLPTSEDRYVFGSLKSTPPTSQAYPHVARWFKHIQSFSDAEQAS